MGSGSKVLVLEKVKFKNAFSVRPVSSEKSLNSAGDIVDNPVISASPAISWYHKLVQFYLHDSSNY